MGDVVMVVEKLEDIPPRTLPEGISLRRYRKGDGDVWTRIHADTHAYDPMPEGLHAREFGGDVAALEERQLFLADSDGTDVATATAWFNDPAHGVPGGRIHWVAVVPAMQRRGLASALLSALRDRFAALGESTAYLTTDSENSRAIALYESLGFRIAKYMG